MGRASRRSLLRAGAAAAALTGMRQAGAASRSSVPNILWLVSEDNNPFIGAYGDTLARTPHIDALAQDGILYQNAFCTGPVCAVSRFAILTGIHAESCAPANHMRAVAQLPDTIRTYPEYLRDAGYYCTNNAKTDYNCDVDPKAIWHASGEDAHWKNRPAGNPFMAVFNTSLTHESCLFNPIAGAVAATDVRVPAYLPDTPEIREDRATYYNAMERMDAQIGSWLQELEQARLAEDTIVFYYSDNGGVLPRSKRYCYDEGLRCALVARVPPKWAHLAPVGKGARIEAPTSFIDLAPTLLSLAGVAPPAHMQGAAFLGFHAQQPRPYAFGARNRMDERYDFVRAVTDGRFHYIRNYTPHRTFQHEAFEWMAKGYQSWEREYRAGRLNTNQARFFAQVRPFEELYDLQADPDQVANVAGVAAYADRLDTMRNALDQHMLVINDNGFIPEGMTVEGYVPSRDPQAYPLRRLMELAADAAGRDRTRIGLLVQALDDPNAIIRHWAILGLLMLGPDAFSARDRMIRVMQQDPLDQNRIAAAETVARLAPSPQAILLLSDLLDHGKPWPVQLQAANALTFAGDQAKEALPAIRRAAESEQEAIRNTGRYLQAVLEGRYEPSYPVLDVGWMLRTHQSEL